MTLFLTGCWSSKEIEDLGIIVATSLDLEEEEDRQEEFLEQEGRSGDRPLFTITNQFVTSKSMNSSSGEESSQQSAYKNISETGDAILPTLRNMTLKNEKRAFAEHSKVIIIGENLARTMNLQQILDFFLREQEIRPSVLILISKDRASSTLEATEPLEIPAFQIVEMIRGHDRTTNILPPVTLAKLEGQLNAGSSFLLQNVASRNGTTRLEGVAVIKGKTEKLIGFLNSKELEGITWIKGKGKGGVVKGFDKESGEPIIYEIMSMKSKITPNVDGNGNIVSFKLNIESEGRISEHWVETESTFKNEFLEKSEKAIEQEVKQLVTNVMDKMQQEYQVEVVGFGKQLRIDYPKLWRKVEKDWDEIFSEIPIKYDIKITINDYGTSGG
ncbi:Ger(x)C family spore germination protein [Sporosarcina sp. Te-1]|nr:Ger(x)C family spore germination protein [Sporosarcina sp. Te-1]